MFADDTKIFRTIDITDLQMDLMKHEEWSYTWLLKFHPEKCKVLTLGFLQKIEKAMRLSLRAPWDCVGTHV